LSLAKGGGKGRVIAEGRSILYRNLTLPNKRARINAAFEEGKKKRGEHRKKPLDQRGEMGR